MRPTTTVITLAIATLASACTPATNRFREHAYPSTVSLGDDAVKLTGFVDTAVPASTWTEIAFDVPVTHRIHILADGVEVIDETFEHINGEKTFRGTVGRAELYARCAVKKVAHRGLWLIRCRLTIDGEAAGSIVFAEGTTTLPEEGGVETARR